MKISLFNDDIGSVEYITHMGDDLTLVHLSIVVLQCVLLFLFS